MRSHDLIRQERLRHGLTQEQLARKAGVALNTVQRLEAGKHNPSMKTLRGLSRALGVRPGRLLGD